MRNLTLILLVAVLSFGAGAQNTYPWPQNAWVGIGIPTAGHPLHIVNPSASIGLKLEGSNAFAPGILLHNTAPTGKKYSIYSSADGNFIIGDETTLKAKMAIWSSGQIAFHSSVSIGYMESGTAGRLDVKGPITATSQYVSQNGTASGGQWHYGLSNGSSGSRFVLGLQTEESGGSTDAYGSDFRIWRYNNSGANALTALSINRNSGNVGIGTDAVENSEGWARALGVWGNPHAKILAYTNNVYSGLWSHDNGFFGAPSGGMAGTWSNHSFSLVTNKQSRLTIAPSGYVGIGTTTPQERLQVGDRLVVHDGGWKGLLYNLAWSDASQKLVRLVSAPVAGMYFTHQGNILFINGPGGVAGATDNSGHSLVIHNSGQVGIGTSVDATSLQDGYYKLYVAGGIRARKVKVDQDTWSDYVFEPSYRLRPLHEVEQYILQNRHLPEVPSASEIQQNGLDLGDNQAVLLKKIEELTLYLIEQNKRIEILERINEELKSENSEIKKKLGIITH